MTTPDDLTGLADAAAAETEKLGTLYRDAQQENGCVDLVCTFPLDGNCPCMNEAFAAYRALAQTREPRDG